mgnify:CR=1 FL=1
MSEGSEEKYSNTTFVIIYLTNMAYGGREEGGWYFPVGEFIKGEAFPSSYKDEIEECVKRFQLWCDEENECRNSNIYSVNSAGEFVVREQSEPGEDYPKTMPHYE